MVKHQLPQCQSKHGKDYFMKLLFVCAHLILVKISIDRSERYGGGGSKTDRGHFVGLFLF